MLRLTDSEWKVMEVLWPSEGLPLGAIVDALIPETGWSRTTVHTYLTRMTAKGLVHTGGQPGGLRRQPAPGAGGAGLPGQRRPSGGGVREGREPQPGGAGRAAPPPGRNGGVSVDLWTVLLHSAQVSVAAFFLLVVQRIFLLKFKVQKN